jgi:hypothetical protein
LIERSRANAILGFSDSETVKLDFDEAYFSTVKFWARTLSAFLDVGMLKTAEHVARAEKRERIEST